MLELKEYQKRSVQKFEGYLDSIRQFGSEKGHNIGFYTITQRQYNSQDLGKVPYVCIKIPTGGGKTLVACHMLSSIYEKFVESRNQRGLVLWLVPTNAIRTQTIDALKNTPIGRSHRHKVCKEKLNEVIIKSKKILQLPDGYHVGIMTGSNTGALEAALWSLLGCKGVDVLAWENFGKDWVIDILDQLKIKDVNSHVTDYGILPDLSKVNFKNDVVFTWNGTTAGVRIPNGDWIPEDREGLTICDATSGIFAMDIDYSKLDVITWSWQKVLGAEAAHGMIALSPRAVERCDRNGCRRRRYDLPALRSDGGQAGGVGRDARQGDRDIGRHCRERRSVAGQDQRRLPCQRAARGRFRRGRTRHRLYRTQARPAGRRRRTR